MGSWAVTSLGESQGDGFAPILFRPREAKILDDFSAWRLSPLVVLQSSS